LEKPASGTAQLHSRSASGELKMTAVTTFAKVLLWIAARQAFIAVQGMVEHAATVST
jgi:hypothetical protein